MIASILIPFIAFASATSAPTVSYYPEKLVQGEPLAIVVSDARTFPVRHVLLGGKSLDPFVYRGNTTVFYGADIREKPTAYPVLISFQNGLILRSEARLAARPKVEAPFGIPEKLGGNTKVAAKALVSTLEEENKKLVGLETADKPLWKEPFAFPTANPYVTDSFGYSRSTVGLTITHKGTDFRADEATPVLAMNDGIVRLVHEGRNYGKTVVIDHGLGVQSFYMHLSRIDVELGDKIDRGDTVGMAGQTGYAEAAHLHLTLRIRDVSIDPVRFLGFFQ